MRLPLSVRHLLLVALLPVCLLPGAPAMAQRAEPPAPVTSARDPEKLKAIRTLLELTGSIKAAQEMVTALINQQAKLNPEIPAEFWRRFKARFKPEELVERMIPVYDKHFTKEEINEIIAFYQSPVGKKMAASQSSIQQEGMAIGQQYGQEIGMQVMAEIQQEEQARKPTTTGGPGKPTKPSKPKRP